jgi:hypothetical protein
LRFVDLPLGVALRQLAGTLHFSLYRWNKPKEPEYYLWQDLKMRTYEEAMRSAEKEKRTHEIQTYCQKVLDEAQKALDMKPEDALKLKDTNPWLAYLGGTKGGRAYAQILTNLPPDIKELVLRGCTISMPLSDLSSELQNAANQVASNSFITQDLLSDFGTHEGWSLYPTTHMIITGVTDGDQMLEYSQMFMAAYEIPPHGGFCMTSRDDIGPVVLRADLPVSVNGSPYFDDELKQLLRWEAGESWDKIKKESIYQRPKPDNAAKLEQIRSTPAPTEQELLIPVRPEKPEEIDEDADLLTRILNQIAKQTKLSIVMEYQWPGRLRFNNPDALFEGLLPTDTQPLYKILAILDAAGLEWEYKERVISIRPKDWAVQRSNDVPESVLAKYRDKLKRDGCFDLDTLASIPASLTDGQIDQRFLNDLELVILGYDLGDRPPLRFYGSLSPQQKTLLKSPEGLTFDQLSDEQWLLLAAMIGQQLGETNIQTGIVRLPEPEKLWLQDKQGKEQRDKSPEFCRYYLTIEVPTENQSKPITIKRTISVHSNLGLDMWRETYKKTNEERKKERNQSDDGQKDKN